MALRKKIPRPDGSCVSCGFSCYVVSMATLRITKRVTFSDMFGNVLRTYEVGDLVSTTGPMTDLEGRVIYFGTAMGGIYADEAEEQG